MFNQVKCPFCHSKTCHSHQHYETVHNGTRTLFQCDDCQQIFSETKGTFLEGIRKPVSLIIKALKSRSEGMGVNAACRVFEIAKNTLLNWEHRFSDSKETLALYSLTHTFLSQVIEGDELYTKSDRMCQSKTVKGGRSY